MRSHARETVTPSEMNLCDGPYSDGVELSGADYHVASNLTRLSTMAGTRHQLGSVIAVGRDVHVTASMSSETWHGNHYLALHGLLTDECASAVASSHGGAVGELLCIYMNVGVQRRAALKPHTTAAK